LIATSAGSSRHCSRPAILRAVADRCRGTPRPDEPFVFADHGAGELADGQPQVDLPDRVAVPARSPFDNAVRTTGSLSSAYSVRLRATLVSPVTCWGDNTAGAKEERHGRQRVQVGARRPGRLSKPCVWVSS
jgi:hypothetical protein